MPKVHGSAQDFGEDYPTLLSQLFGLPGPSWHRPIRLGLSPWGSGEAGTVLVFDVAIKTLVHSTDSHVKASKVSSKIQASRRGVLLIGCTAVLALVSSNSQDTGQRDQARKGINFSF